jgi:predicted DNA-binding transcriptional regulator YafY
MPKSKNADIRYRVIDKCLRDKNHRYTIYDLAQKCTEAVNYLLDPLDEYNISIRQIRMDINHMSSEAGFQAPIVSRKIPGVSKHYFTYEDPDFSISNIPLTEEDIANLKSSLFLLQRFGGTHHEEWIHDFAVRIEELPVRKKPSGIDVKTPNLSEKAVIVQFDHQDTEGGGEFIIPLYQAIEKKQAITITYKEFKSEEEKNYHISPYLLKQYNRRWFLLCKSENLGYVTTLPLDRMIDIQPSIHDFVLYTGPGKEPVNFFDDIIGVTNDSRLKVEELELEVHSTLLPYLKTKVLHESQKMEKPTSDPHWFSIRIKVKPNYELYSVLLSHGPRIRVVAPKSIQNKMEELILEMQEHYGN